MSNRRCKKTQSPEFSNSIFIKFLGHSLVYFKLLIYLPELKRPKNLRGSPPPFPFLEHLLTGLLHEPVTELIYSTSRPPSAFYSIFVQKWTFTFKSAPLKEMTMMNLIIAKNESDPYDAMVSQLAIDSL